MRFTKKQTAGAMMLGESALKIAPVLETFAHFTVRQKEGKKTRQRVGKNDTINSTTFFVITIETLNLNQ
jgi:hypothetical protein